MVLLYTKTRYSNLASHACVPGVNPVKYHNDKNVINGSKIASTAYARVINDHGIRITISYSLWYTQMWI